MTTIVTRAGKGSALTHNEVDSNFTNLNSAKYESGNNVTLGTISGTTITASTAFSGALNGTVGATTPAAGTFTNLAYTGTLTGGTGVINIGSGQVYKDASGNVGIGTASPSGKLDVNGLIISKIGSTADASLGVQNSIASFFLLQQSDKVNFYTGAGQPFVFTTSNIERMRIDSSGNVGIGTSTPTARLDVNGSTTVSSQTNVAAVIGPHVTSDVLIGSVNGNTPFVASQGAYPLTFNTNATERMRIDSSGNVGIGTSSPSARLQVVGTGAAGIGIGVGVDGTAPSLDINGGSDGGNGPNIIGRRNGSIEWIISSLRGISGGGAQGLAHYTAGATPIVFYTNNTERMRIDSSGNVNIGTSSPIFSPRLGVSTGASDAASIAFDGNFTGIHIINLANTNYVALKFWNNGVAGTVGEISCSTTATAYNTSSDYRLKENVAPMVGALDTVAQLKPVTYTWKADGSDGQGFIAHELQAVVPDAVTGEKDAVDKDGKPVYQGIDTSFLVATLTKAIQEQQALIDNLTTRLTALEGN